MKKLIKIHGESYIVESKAGGKCIIVSKKGATELTFEEVIIVVQECKDGKGETIT